MPKTLLVIDTAFDFCQLGLWQDDTCITMVSVPGGGKYDIVLAPLLDEMLAAHKIAVKDISKIAVTTGPGRFTGLRVGIAFARGLALVNSIPLTGISIIDTLVWQCDQSYPGREDIALVVAVKRGESFVKRGQHAMERVMDDQMVAYLTSHKISLVAGVLSSEVLQIIEGIDGVAVATDIAEPGLEALFAIAKDQSPQENSLVRPFYAL